MIRLGCERALIYKTLILTGLRKGELAMLRWSDLHLEEPNPWLQVRAEIARSAALPIRSDLVDDLKVWKATVGGEGRVFTVAAGIDRIFKRDLAAAKILAKDADGRVVDVRALRHTTASHLATAGVAPRTAQALMRHSDIRLTLGTYSDPQMLDTAAKTKSTERKSPQERHLRQQAASIDTACRKAGDRIRTDDVQLGKLAAASSNPLKKQQLTEPPPGACTNACTKPRESCDGDGSGPVPERPAASGADDELAKVTAAWPTLPEAIRAGILAMVKAANG